MKYITTILMGTLLALGAAVAGPVIGTAGAAGIISAPLLLLRRVRRRRRN